MNKKKSISKIFATVSEEMTVAGINELNKPQRHANKVHVSIRQGPASSHENLHGHEAC